MEALKDILELKESLYNIYGDFYNIDQNFYKAYKFSNEDIYGYYKLFDLENKDVLTVCGSGDQALNAILMGAKTVDTFDINKLAYYLMQFKMYAIKYLNYNEFNKLYDNFQYYAYFFYRQIKKSIKDYNFILFWDEFIKNVNVFFIGDDCDINPDKIPYLDKELFIRLKNKLLNYDLTFKRADIYEIPNVFEKKYDFINLSNILDYRGGSFHSFKNFMIKLIQNNLNDEGSILLKYGFKNDDDLLQKYIRKLHLSTAKKLILEDSQDKIYVYTKK